MNANGKISGRGLELARKIKDITQDELGAKLGGIIKQNISMWEREVRPIPKKYYPDLEKIFGNDIYDDIPEIPGRPMKAEDFTENSEVKPLDLGKVKAVPVLSFAQAAGYEPALIPLCDYIRETSDKSALFIDVKDNYFALEVSGDSMSPDYPDGSIALVASGEFPERGDIVAAKLLDGEVVIKEYHRKNNVITLQSINPNGKSFEWNCKENPGYIQWMWPVIEIALKPRARRWAKTIIGEAE